MKRNKLSHIEAHNEVGELVYFEMPHTAMYFGTGQVTNNDEERIRGKIEKMATQYCAKADKPDSAFSDLNGKMKYVNKKQKTGGWI